MLKKIFLTISLLVISQSAVFGQWTNTDEINDFSKLLTSHINPFLLKKGAAVEAKNLRADETYGALSKRSKTLSYGSAGSFAITGFHRYYQANGNQYLIVSGSTYLKSDKNNSGTFIIIRDELTDGRRWSFVTYMDKMIGVNGLDNPQKYDGHTKITANTDGARTVNILTSDLGAPYAELNTGSNLDASSWYQYKIAHYNGSVYYYSTARSNPILTGAAVRDISLTDIPFGPAGTTHRYIYRTLGNSTRANVEADTAFYLVGTIADNTTDTFNDTTIDDDADDAASPIWAIVSAGSDVSPPVSKLCEIHKERLWLANNPSYESDVYWSYAYKPDIFNASDYEPIREDDGDEVTFIKNQLGVLVIGKTNSIMKFSTFSSNSDQWAVLGPFSTTGCHSPYTAVNSHLGIIYLSKNGIYVFNGESSSLISEVVTPELRDILWVNKSNAAAVYFDNEYQLAYTSIASGASANNRVLIFNTGTNSYSIDTKELNVFEVFDSGSDEGTLYSGSSADDGYIYAHTYSDNELAYRTEEDFDTGTLDSVAVLGTRRSPSLELSWGFGCDDSYFSGLTTNSAALAGMITDRPETTGYWWSPVVQISATDLDKLYWSEFLGGYGDVTLAVRFGASVSAVNSASWSSEYSDPTGSDISGLTANDYVQIRATLTSSSINYTPAIRNIDNFAIKMTYSKEGSVAETAIDTIYKTGWMALGNTQRKKRIWEIEIFYEGDEGDIDFTLENLKGDISKTFEIDISVNQDDDPDDEYTGNSNTKSYLWRASIDEDTPIGRYFQYTLEDDGITDWTIFKIITRYSNEDIY